ncbi:hypothetical protein [Streptomyces sp. NPDC048825]|uniref:hypothetical protein n=1 Tax=Streptomyces sp. NPDC048825 TaxID=3365592 RepID=UPI00371210E5
MGLLLFCLWPMTVGFMVCYPLARWARKRARTVFPSQGHRRIPDPGVLRVQKTRAWIATAISAGILVVYGKPGDMDQAQELFIMRLAFTPWLLLLSAPLVVWLLYCWASADRRRTMRPYVRTAGRSALMYFGAFSALPLFFLAFNFAEDVVQPPALAWVQFGLLLPALWLLFFVVFATGPAVRSAFNTADVHAALPALLTGVLVWEFAVISVAAGGLPPGPPTVQFGAVLGGPASVTAVAWWEIRRLRHRYGVTLRG